MDKGRFNYNMYWILTTLTFVSLATWAAPPVKFDQSVLRFNTLCAKCHEGECSGRLSFSLDPEATFSHIRRYAEDVDDSFVHQLIALLGHMKLECAYAPLPVLDIHGLLQREILDDYRDPVTGDYFIPLGKLEPGIYRLTLRFEHSGLLRIEVLNKWFDFLVDEISASSSTVFPVILEVEETSEHYLRLRSRTELRLEELTLRLESLESIN